jgi:pimeloyl-ACP methyl ester carboxylesterase
VSAVRTAERERERRRSASPEPPPAGRIADLIARGWMFTPPRTELPDPTPSDGPDPYGNPDPDWLRIDWREHLRTVDVDTVAYPNATGGTTTINYVDLGPTEAAPADAGPPITFVHGLGGSWQNWLENIPRFVRRHRVVALDLPGFGQSPLPTWSISIPRHGRVLLDFCRQLGLGGGAVVGNSMGGFVAAEAVIQSAEAFEKLVLVSAAGISHSQKWSGPAVVAARMSAVATPAFLRLHEQVLRRPRLRLRIFGGLFHNPLKLRTELLWEFARNGASTDGFLPAVRGMIGYDFLDRLEGVDASTLIVWGRNDRIVPAADSAGYGRRLRNSRTVIYDRCGHCPMAERPVRFNRELEEFLAAGATT